MTDQLRPRKPAPPIASDARVADGRTSCGICGRKIPPGSRGARLASGEWAHLNPCIISMLGGRP